MRYTSLLLAITLPWSVGAGAQQKASLRLGSDGAAGGTEKGDWIDIQSWRWGTSIPTSVGQQPAKELRKPADIGSLTVTVKMDPASCKLGAKYDGARLRTPKIDYVLEEAMISCCATGGSTSGGELPTESMSLNYTKITQDYGPQDKKAGTKPDWDTKKGKRE